MPLDLDDTERAPLIGLLRGEIENTRYPLAPVLHLLRSALAKLGVETRRRAVSSLPPPEPSMALRRGRSGLALLAAALVIATTNYATGRDINLKDMVTAEGECRIELVRGAGYGRCDDGVIYMLFRNGRHLIMFHNKDDVIALAGAGDRQPRLEDYYINIDTFRLTIPGRKEAVDTNMEGECHIRVTKERGDFRSIECDAYDRAKGLGVSARVDNIRKSTHKPFD